MDPTTLHQLSDGDAVFLATETDHAYSHIGGLSILDPSGVEGFGYESFLRQIEERIRLVPRFTWKLETVPLGLDRPYWVECPDFDVRQHVRRIAVPSPGGQREVCELGSYLFSRPLDRSRPLWEIWFIEGVEGGKVAMFMKTHHCLMDGEAGASLAEVLTDLAPDATAPPIVPDSMQEAPPQTPDALQMALRFARNAAQRSVKAAEHASHAARDLGRLWMRSSDTYDPPAWSEVPKLRFNAGIGPRRSFATATLSLSRLKELKKHFDVTLNDVVLEIIGAALRRWLRTTNELPEAPLVALCPVSLRDADDKSLSNQITTMPVSLATDLDDPVLRLQRIAKNAERSKELVAEGHFEVLTALGESLAPAAVRALVRTAEMAPGATPLPGNLVVSNVRGTPIPLYTAGARVESMYPMSVLQTGQGLNATVVSYMDKMDFGFTADPDLVPDLDVLIEEVQRAFDELQGAAEGVVHTSR